LVLDFLFEDRKTNEGKFTVYLLPFCAISKISTGLLYELREIFLRNHLPDGTIP